MRISDWSSDVCSSDLWDQDVTDDHRLQRENDRERPHLRAEQNQDQTTQQDQQADGDHYHGEDRLADQAREEDALDGEAEKGRCDKSQRNANPVWKADRSDHPPDHEAPKHHKLALSKIENLGGTRTG